LFTDVVEGFRQHELWRAFAWDEIKNRYRNSVLGVLWIIAAYAIFVAGISIFFSRFTQSYSTQQFIVYVALGYATFQYLMGNISDGTDVFASSSSWIKSSNLPYSIYVYKSMFRSLLPFLMQMTVAFTVMGIFGQLSHLGWGALMALPALIVFIICAVPLQYMLGLISARYRDVKYTINAITRIMIFITPILWVREDMGGNRAKFADYNPLAHFLEIFRAPLMGEEARPVSWIVVLCATLSIWALATIVSMFMRRRLPYWI
jgi:ABC-2 type transport system permease protein